MGRLPRISIVTPCFNQGHFLETTIKSVLSQEYENLEYIVIDGGSTDGSVDIIKRYADRLAYWVSEPDGGQAEAIIKGFQHSSGEIMGWLNSDDLLLSDCLTAVARTFIGLPTTQMMYGNILIIDEYGHVVKEARQFQVGFHELYYGGHIINQEATFWTRGLYDRAGGLNRNLSYAMDYDLWVRMAEISHPLHVSRYLAAFRRHPSQKTTHMELYRMEMQAIQDRTRSARGENPFAFAVKSGLCQTRLILRRCAVKLLRTRRYPAKNHRAAYFGFAAVKSVGRKSKRYG
ncbi:MAG: glycosyltransferase [Candidatus Methylomirabilota bacterium]|nr:glycosyltransferase [Candidatus Methylomirabilis sp.]NJD69899.1 glycosyltransferase [candidate division NC10 bacterium]PWB46168.1 MAG: glycosyltransferase [candidate division NC10 bacterium]